MKIEYKLVVKAPNRKTYIHEYSENRKELEKKASIMSNEHPDWNVFVCLVLPAQVFVG